MGVLRELEGALRLSASLAEWPLMMLQKKSFPDPRKNYFCVHGIVSVRFLWGRALERDTTDSWDREWATQCSFNQILVYKYEPFSG